MDELNFNIFDLNNEHLNSDLSEGVEQYYDMENGAYACALEPEIRTDVPGCEVALISGDPFTRAEVVDYAQGDNSYHAEGNCGIVSVTNILRISGMDISEEETTAHAIENGECAYNPFYLVSENGEYVYDPLHVTTENGGTTMELQERILADYGIESSSYSSAEFGLNEIAEVVENGHGVIAEINADILWDADLGSTGFYANHAITITGVARDAASGAVAGVYICDSGRGEPSDACRFVSAELFNDCYSNISNSGVVVTDAPLETRHMINTTKG